MSTLRYVVYPNFSFSLISHPYSFGPFSWVPFSTPLIIFTALSWTLSKFSVPFGKLEFPNWAWHTLIRAKSINIAHDTLPCHLRTDDTVRRLQQLNRFKRHTLPLQTPGPGQTLGCDQHVLAAGTNAVIDPLGEWADVSEFQRTRRPRPHARIQGSQHTLDLKEKLGAWT